MYGFHKVPHLQQGGLISDSPDADSWEFSNENFQRGQPDLLHFIRRKKAHRDSVSAEVDVDGEADENNDDGPEQEVEVVSANDSSQKQQAATPASVNSSRQRVSRTPPVNLARILKEIQVIRDHQLTISSDIKRLQQENQSLWMQAADTDERSKKQQETIDKILRFLATVFSSDIRQSEIHLPLRRLISHDGGDRVFSADVDSSSSSSIKGKGHSGMNAVGRGKSRASYQNSPFNHQQQQQQQQSQEQQQQQQQRKSQYQAMLNGKGDIQFTKSRSVLSTPRTQSIFEEMDFPDSTSSEIQLPAGKRMRTEAGARHPARIFEMSPGATPSIETAASPKTASGGSLQRKVSAAKMSSSAEASASQPASSWAENATRQMPLVAPVSNSASSSALVPSSPTGSMLSRLGSHSKSLDRLNQDSDAINHSLEALLRLFSPASIESAAAADYFSAHGSGQDAGSASNASVGGIGGQNASGDLAAGGLTAADLSNEDSLLQLLSSEEFSNLAMSLANTTSAAANPNNSNNANVMSALGADGSIAHRPGLADPFGYTGNQQTPAPTLAGAADIFDTMSTGSPASSNNGNYNAQLLLEAIKSLTPEQQQSMLNYYRLTGQLNHMPLLTAGDAGSITNVDSPEAVNTTPFLEFVDPNAEPALGALGSEEPVAETIGAHVSDATNADYDILFKDVLDASNNSSSGDAINASAVLLPSSSSASASVAASGLDISGIDPSIAASLFQTAPILTSVAQSPSAAADFKTGDHVGQK
ncbi:Heat shock transcription factor [Coemansia sp. RSA 2598]|nr:Heat shock transcription factor [Coemansia sp. RSA 2598]